jgi:PIN domain nuclease of toxin-antitoxin system
LDYVFDACAVIAFLNDENGADIVAGLINQAGIGADHDNYFA